MTIRTLLVSFSAALVAISAALGCEIHNCEHGATCTDHDWGDDDQRSECTTYCGRLSVCGAAQAQDFDDCLDACKDRFERLPDETHRLCSCAPQSSCGDVIEGRCSPGTQSSGSGGSCNSCGTGGASSGNPSGGSGNGYGGASNGLGGSSASGGATVGGASSGNGGDAGISCQAACDCPVDYACVSGRCVAL